MARRLCPDNCLKSAKDANFQGLALLALLALLAHYGQLIPAGAAYTILL